VTASLAARGGSCNQVINPSIIFFSVLGADLLYSEWAGASLRFFATPLTPTKGHHTSAVAESAIPLFAAVDDDWRSEARRRESAARGDKQPDESRFLGLDSEPDEQFLRAQKRVPVRRGAVTRKTANRLRQACIAVGVIGAAALAGAWTYRYAQTAPRFRIASSEQIVISGARNVTRKQVLELFGADIGRNALFVPLDDRKRQLEHLPWVRSAAVMRLLPNELRVAVEERQPLAFAQVGARFLLIDGDGVLLEPPVSGKLKYSFPVLIGMSEAEPLSTRAARMKIYGELVRELDSGGARYSSDLSEIDLRDPDDVKVTVADDAGAVLVHLGDSNFLDRFKTYISHIEGWRQQYHKIESVDLRFDRQVVVHPDAPPQMAKNTAPVAAAAVPSAAAAKSHWKPLHKSTKQPATGSHGQRAKQYSDRH
jgi:cell division protein FtsQ